MPKPVPDPEVDFDGCLQALTDNAIAEVDGMADAERWRHYMEKAMVRLVEMWELPDCPDILVQMAEARLEKLLIQRRTGTYPSGPLPGHPEWFP